MDKKANGALNGAVSGAAMGSALGPYGAAVGGVVGGVAGLIGSGDDSDSNAAMAALQQNRDIYGSINAPQYSPLNPDLYQVAGQYDPKMASANTISEDPSTRNAQLSVLGKMAGLADTGLSDVDQQGYQHAQEMGNQVAKGGTDAAIANAAQRGVGGSGMEFAMREMANQGGAQRANEAGLGQAADSARMRAMYTQAYGQGLSGLRGEDYRAGAGNANILNQFNMANTGAANDAQKYNLGNAQAVGNANVGQRNYAHQYNNDLGQREFQDKMAIAGGASGANNNLAQGYAAKDAASTSNTNSNMALAAQTGVNLYAANKKSGGADATAPTQ